MKFFLLLVIITLGCNAGNRQFKRKEIGGEIVEANFLNDTLIDGVAKYYDKESSTLVRKVCYRQGQKDGLSVIYRENGSIYDSLNYSNNILNGPRYIFDDSGRLSFGQNYYHGVSIGGQYFFNKGVAKRYVYSDFEKKQLYEVLYDSVGAPYKYGGEIINANLYKVTVDGDSTFFGIFVCLLRPPNISINYSIGVTNEKTKEDKYLGNINGQREFIDTVLKAPGRESNYFISADYNDTLNKYHKVFMTVLKW
jgi:antitoxin component YwqK of YwqJK toxin-antitoxin module